MRGRRVVLISALLLAVGLVTAWFLRGRGITARREPFPLEASLAKAAWKFLVPRDIRNRPNPVPGDPETLKRAMAHFADHCAVCHGNDGRGDTLIGRNVHPRAPDLRLPSTQNLTDGELFYAIEVGIPWTAMPAFGNGTDDGERDSWELVRFVRHLPSLTREEVTYMEQFNPKTPATSARDREIEDFLSGAKPSGKGK